MKLQQMKNTPSSNQLAQRAIRQATAKFWGCIAHFAGCSPESTPWRQAIPADHPFLIWYEDANKLEVKKHAKNHD